MSKEQDERINVLKSKPKDTLTEYERIELQVLSDNKLYRNINYDKVYG